MAAGWWCLKVMWSLPLGVSNLRNVLMLTAMFLGWEPSMELVTKILWGWTVPLDSPQHCQHCHHLVDSDDDHQTIGFGRVMYRGEPHWMVWLAISLSYELALADFMFSGWISWQRVRSSFAVTGIIFNLRIDPNLFYFKGSETEFLERYNCPVTDHPLA